MQRLSRLSSFLTGRSPDAGAGEPDQRSNTYQIDISDVQVGREQPSGSSEHVLDDTVPVQVNVAGPLRSPERRERKDTPFYMKGAKRSSTPRTDIIEEEADDEWSPARDDDFGSPILPITRRHSPGVTEHRVRFQDDSPPTSPLTAPVINRPKFGRSDSMTALQGSQGESPDRSVSKSPAPYAPATPYSGRRYISKPRNFDGKDWAAYRLHFMSCVRSNNWSPDDAAQILTAHLAGEAAFVLTSRDAHLWSLDELLQVLDNRYEVAGPDYIVKGKLRRTNQLQGQGLQAFADSIMKITWTRYGVEGAELAREQFISGLSDTRMQQHVAKKGPESLEEALLVARQYEETDKWVSQSQRRESRRVAHISMGAPSDDQDESDEEVDKPVTTVSKPVLKVSQVTKTEPGVNLIDMAKTIKRIESQLTSLDKRIPPPRPQQRFNGPQHFDNRPFHPIPQWQGEHGAFGEYRHNNQAPQFNPGDRSGPPNQAQGQAPHGHHFQFKKGNQDARLPAPPAPAVK